MKRSAAELREQMDKLFIGKPAVDTSRKRNTVYMRPELVAEIEYLGWTHDAKLRHASYKGCGRRRITPRFMRWNENYSLTQLRQLRHRCTKGKITMLRALLNTRMQVCLKAIFLLAAIGLKPAAASLRVLRGTNYWRRRRSSLRHA